MELIVSFISLGAKTKKIEFPETFRNNKYWQQTIFTSNQWINPKRVLSENIMRVNGYIKHTLTEVTYINIGY